jgi:hypothetical protein
MLKQQPQRLACLVSVKATRAAFAKLKTLSVHIFPLKIDVYFIHKVIKSSGDFTIEI